MSRAITNRMLQKLSLYLTYLKGLPEHSPEYISAPMIAESLHMGEVNVRKDLAAVTRRGCPKCGRKRSELISDLESFLGQGDPCGQPGLCQLDPAQMRWVYRNYGLLPAEAGMYPWKGGNVLHGRKESERWSQTGGRRHPPGGAAGCGGAIDAERN